MNIREKLSKIQTDFKAKKSRFNSFGKYNFRSAEDILEALKPFNKEHQVYFIIEENLTLREFPVMHSTATIVDTKSGDKINASAIVGVDLAQKGMQMPQKFGTASSYGKKYALGNLLLIDDTADPDATNTYASPIRQKLQLNETPKSESVTKPVINNKNIVLAQKFLSNGGLLKTLQEKYDIEDEALKILNG
jgi:hypothetical protein